MNGSIDMTTTGISCEVLQRDQHKVYQFQLYHELDWVTVQGALNITFA